MRIWEYDLRLYRLLKNCLPGDYVSAARDPLTPAMRTGMLESLRAVELGNCCGCGDAFCHTFTTQATPDSGEEFFTVRFHVNDELQVTCDANGVIYRIQWLRFNDAENNNLKCFALTAAGWAERPIAGN